ncbi:methyltransferase-like 26 isoform X2 [Odontomachus brunneus]|nr:methyltransferase-like 26 isoform X2 [Odontomachus brunneus]XP_032664741.1 methyltransferase-like 26 isoform X2 [Odontomachus brunneus]
MAVEKLIYPAAERNKDPILSLIKRYIRPGANQTFLEISSGSGQHVAHFAPYFPHVTFYPSEYEQSLLGSITAHANGHANIKKPMLIDITTDFSLWGNDIFKPNSLDYMYNANMMHITPYQCTISLFWNAGQLLKNNGLLITYGPYACDNIIYPQSNVKFHNSLKSQNRCWGLRDIRDLRHLAAKNDMSLMETVEMPAHNKTLIWKKYAGVEAGEHVSSTDKAAGETVKT